RGEGPAGAPVGRPLFGARWPTAPPGPRSSGGGRDFDDQRAALRMSKSEAAKDATLTIRDPHVFAVPMR
ncbi:unnamed protein product, partial [Urochloa humidicola]